MRLQDKVRGALIGGALGDAMGAPVEKLSAEEIQRLYGKVESLDIPHFRVKSRTHGKGYGRFTDDTLMVILLCQVYEELGGHLDAYAVFPLVRKMVFEEIWVPEYQKKMPLIERLFYPEKYIFLSNCLANRDPRSGGVGNMVNCGAAMYLSPVGLVNAGDPEGAYREAIAFASAHQTSYGLEAAGVYAACVAAAMTPEITVDDILAIAIASAKDGTKKAILSILNAVPEVKQPDDCPHVFHKALEPFSSMGDDLQRSPDKIGLPTDNYAPSRTKSIEELPMALGYIAYYREDFHKALAGGVNSGRDTDSIGCMIGTILGAWLGIQAIDPKMVEQLVQANRYPLTEIADQLTGTILRIQETDQRKAEALHTLRKQLCEEVKG
ncbi:MAG TPA: ADP-ribosylglycohydrolase family protein [Thermotogota bacterium]|nr:ADP-ribosylglycohydrolase family protein [Thermotogota bacterium]